MELALDLGTARFHPDVPWYARWRYRTLLREALTAPSENPLRRWLSAVAGYSSAAASKGLAHFFGKTEFAFISNGAFLALMTATGTAATTNAEVEAKEATYTGYARKQIVGTEFTTSEATTSRIKNNAQLEFPAVSSGGDTITAWAVTNKKKGEATTTVIMYGTCGSTVLSTTQTPPVVATEKLVGEVT